MHALLRVVRCLLLPPAGGEQVAWTRVRTTSKRLYFDDQISVAMP